MRDHQTTEIHLLDEDEDGTERELTVTAYYRVQPAEPDVGYMSDYAELDFVSTYIEGFGEIIIDYAEHFEDQIRDELELTA